MNKLNRKIIRKMILQEAIIIKKERMLAERNFKIAKFCALKESKMLSEGYSRMEVNESILGDILGLAGDSLMSAPGGFIDTIEQMIIEKILTKLFGSYDPDTFLGAVISNVIENIDFTSIAKYFGENNCEPIVDTLYNGISEAIIQQGITKIFGVDSQSGLITNTMKEAFTNAVNSTEFQTTLRNGIKEVICNQDFASILDTVAGGLGSVADSAKDYFTQDTENSAQ